MANTSMNILVIDDNETLREGVAQVVEKMGHAAFKASNGAQGLALFKKHAMDFTITDLKMEGVSGMEVLKTIREADPTALVMIITAFGTIEVAVDAMKEGAFDFITKPFPPSLLRAKVQKALEVGQTRRENEKLRAVNDALKAELSAPAPLPGGGEAFLGESEPMRRVFGTIQKVARTDSTVYVYGESGTGKEVVAKAIHQASARASGPFIKVNCGALAESLLESELFGHEKGSFTGAHKRKIGRFELADGGTLFLDEIGDISPSIQLKLLRVLQEREFERVGGEESVKVDVRVVAATNKDLKEQVAAGKFREDLFYRLHIIPITLPPLRERSGDIPLLVEHFIKKLVARTRAQVRGITPRAMDALRAYSFPGNVRELENIIEQSLVFAESDVIDVGDLPPVVTSGPRRNILQIPEGDKPLPEILDELERQLIVRAYCKAQGVKTETARLLGIKTSALYYKLEKYSIDEAILASAGITPRAEAGGAG
jgi:two-component system response regulator HydG